MDQPPKPPIPYLLAYAFTLAARRADEELRPYGLSVRKFGLLVQLQLEPELTMSELARQLGVSRQSLHELVGELERAGHLSRLPGATGRTRRLVLSRSARRLIAHAEEPLTRMEADFLGDMDPSEVETLRTLLQRLLAHATDDETWLAGT
ncbi:MULTISPECIES: MarR family winged helix-turn-helix transcriptional regulator [Streptosporangium]|uniref:DNA-binding transcriptional regulator, MarR family n=1 Tax=Streptosporangium subroseum TaxID=106412 RepID=A0A239DJ14_9ACTN|nr:MULTISPECIES: MarR family transcriptional regulator [Streptosporangium]AWS44957.1 HTH domain-containing protein [Streptosporangium sp. 'caverna']SNS31703.1 DNA-binding transcriptional regulator, MarR family [Streptosporangium subroseum]